MSTRATIKVYSEEKSKKPMVSIYHHFDGYLEGLGVRLEELGKDIDSYANGMGCFSARLIAELKGTAVGDVYIDDPKRPHGWIEFIYEFRPRKIGRRNETNLFLKAFGLDLKGDFRELQEINVTKGETFNT